MKSTINKAKLELISRKLKTLAHPGRLAILRLLEKEGPLSVMEIYSRLGTEQAVTSHHLGKMKEAGILKVTRKGQFRIYSLSQDDYSRVLDCLNEYS